MQWPVSVARLRRVAVLALAAFTVTLIGFSRYTVPTGLAAPAEIPPVDDTYVFQISGFIDIPPRGDYRLGIAAYGRSRIVLDGRVIAETRAAGGALSEQHVAPGVHRLLIQYERLEGGEVPVLSWVPAGGAGSRVPRGALSPRRLSPAAWSLRRNLDWLALGVALLWMVAAAAAGARRAWAWFVRNLPPTETERRAACAVIALGIAVFAYPFWWGGASGWSEEELPPLRLADIAKMLSPGWSSKYPPMHYYVLAGVNFPILLADRLELLDIGVRSVYAIVKAVNNLVSAGMAVATAALVYLCAARAAGSRVGILAALMWTLTLPAAYYSKTANLDMPFTFWFAVALVGYQRALNEGSAAAHVLFAAAASLSVATKDQAYGLFLLPAVHLAVARARRVGGRWFGAPALARDPAILGAVAAGLLVFAAAHNLLFNWSGFRAHVATITGWASESYRMVQPTSVPGQLWLLSRTIQQIGWSLSWPGAALAAVGIALAARLSPSKRARLLPFLVPAVSYYLTFIAVVAYTYDRFVLPICVVLAIFAGLALDRLWPPAAPAEHATLEGRNERLSTSRWRTVAAAGLLVFMALRTGSINLLMAADSRYVVQRWMRAHVAPGTEVAILESREFLPDLTSFRVRHLPAPVEQFGVYRSPVVVISENYRRRFAPDAPQVTWHDTLLAEKLGYRIALRHRTRVPLAILTWERQFRDPDPSFSVLHKVNPEIAVLVRDD